MNQLVPLTAHGSPALIVAAGAQTQREKCIVAPHFCSRVACGRSGGYYPGMPPHRSEPGPPMTLGNMRANGVRGLDMTCFNCRHHSRLDVDAYPDHLPVLDFGPRMVCTRCGIIGADARPNWKEQPERPTLTGAQWATS